MREASESRTATDTGSHAFLIFSPNANVGMSVGIITLNMLKYFVACIFLLSAILCNAESRLHLFCSSDWYLSAVPIKINGEEAFQMKGEPVKKAMTGDMYKKSYTLCHFPEDEKISISYDITWYGVPYHEEIVISLEDDEDVYVKLYMPGLFEAATKGRNSFQFKTLSTKEGLKELKKVEKGKYTRNPDYIAK